MLPRHTVELLRRLEDYACPLLSGWTLAGGTGLALRLGHRCSDDLDLFRSDDVDVRDLHGVLARQGSYETLQEADHSLTVLLRETKLSFFRLRDPFLFDGTPYRFFEIADVRDIALMKLVAISGRGSRRDFVDMYCILRDGGSLADHFGLLPRKYDASRINTYHILKSLTYFDDAEAEPMPDMRVPFSWDECKAFFVREARSIVLR
ncbi:MAG: hypothetical protein AUJ92_18930 [Armatimonadetes bacterium CG2_30_59_28]|nr:MAG: hypothetical protein AUJ92_18930 [Armatimonadetes bacterium CG2_30_59_28]